MNRKSSILCPACKEPWITPEGKWSVCVNCPFRDVSSVRDADSREDRIMADIVLSDDGKVSGVVDLKKVFKRIHELEQNERKLLRQIAELHIRNSGVGR